MATRAVRNGTPFARSSEARSASLSSASSSFKGHSHCILHDASDYPLGNHAVIICVVHVGGKRFAGFAAIGLGCSAFAFNCFQHDLDADSKPG